MEHSESQRINLQFAKQQLHKQTVKRANPRTVRLRITIEIDIEVYNKAAELFENLGTTIEDMTVGFLRFCVIPENLPLLKAYLGIENAPAEAGAQPDLHHRIFKQVFDIATKNTG